MDNATVLCVEHLCTSFFTQNGEIKAVNDVSISVPRGRIIGIVGESGCGKSMTARSIMRLLHYPGRIVSGSIKLTGTELLELSEHEMSAVRGEEIGMIFQEPMTALNPLIKVGKQVRECLLTHQKGISKKEAKSLVLEQLKSVGLPDVEDLYECYPHQLSGGQRQRVMIAMAFINNPALLIADEPTTALDVIHRNGIIDLFSQMKANGVGILMVTHDFATALQLGGSVLMMKEGKIIESGEVQSVFDHTTEPYTRSLIEAYSLSCAFTKGAES